MRECPEHGEPLVGVPCDHCLNALREASSVEREAAERHTRKIVQTGEFAAYDERAERSSRRLIQCARCQKLVKTRRRPGEEFGCPACKKRYVLRDEDVLEESPAPSSERGESGRIKEHEGTMVRPSFSLTETHVAKLRRIMKAEGHPNLSRTVRWLIERASDPAGS